MKNQKLEKVYLLLLLLASTSVYSQNLYNNPESVVYDSTHKRYLVSNWGDGDGKIVQIDSSGNQSYFSTTLAGQFKIAGLYLYNNILLAAAGDAPGAGIAGFDLNSGDTLFFIALPGIGLPNDITSDSNGVIFVTDYWGDKLYKIENQVPTIFINGGLGSPNGIYYDKLNHRLLILSVMGVGYPILAVNPEDAGITTVTSTEIPATDGITADNDGNYYISEWYTDNIYQYDNNFSYPPNLFSSGHNDPADIYYDKVNNVLAVPNFSSNTVDFVELTTSVFNQRENKTSQKIVLQQIDPNPFRLSTMVKYIVHQESHVKLKICDSFGKEIKLLINETQKQGKFSSLWDGTNNSGHTVPPGIYHCNIQTGTINHSMKIIKTK